MGRSELVAELKELRKTSGHKPVSKMKVTDISVEIERLKNRTANTPAVASYSAEKSTPSKMELKEKDVKKAKDGEYEKVLSKGVTQKEKGAVAKPTVVEKKVMVKKAEKMPVKKSKKVLEPVGEGDSE